MEDSFKIVNVSPHVVFYDHFDAKGGDKIDRHTSCQDFSSSVFVDIVVSWQGEYIESSTN